MNSIVIVSGMSGAGKSQALRAFDELGYFCADNVLPQLIPEMAKTLGAGSMQQFDRAAVVVDSRVGEFFRGIYSALDSLTLSGIPYKLMFLDARDDVLLNRYQETRRCHPMSKGSIVSEAIALERKVTAELRAKADILIDTSDMDVRTLKQRIYAAMEVPPPNSEVLLLTFGFKRGIPPDCDFVFDCRWLDNPYHDLELRPLNGTDRRVADYVMGQADAVRFTAQIADLIRLVLPRYRTNVKRTVVVGIGCTGGVHRSVAVAEAVAALLKGAGVAAALTHRDVFIQ